jgi:diaminopimelate epimerase
MQFWKYHGIGNDFILVEDFGSELLASGPSLAQTLCQRHFGVGADGLVLITNEAGLYTMRIFNADGSEAEMCGNAIRCVADHLFSRGYADGDSVIIGTISGAKPIKRSGSLYAVDMGEPQFEGADLPKRAGAQTVEVLNNSWEIHPVSMGNPHGVVFVQSLDEVDFEKIGPILECHPIWPAQANIEFVKVENSMSIKVKVWERGVGPTLACGTGACAAAVWASRLGMTGRSVTVTLPGGELEIHWDGHNHVWMTGPAVKVFSGTIEGR